MEEAPLLLPVERIVGGIEVQHDPRRGPGVAIEEVVHETVLDRAAVVDELVVARGLGLGALQTVERAAAGQGMAAVAGLTTLGSQQIRLADRQGQQHIVAQSVVVVQILVAQRLAEHALAQQLLDRVLDALGTPVVREARRKPADQPRVLGHLAKQQNARVRALVAPIKRGLHPPAPERLKLQLSRTTLCLHRVGPPVHDLSLSNKPLAGTVSRCEAPE